MSDFLVTLAMQIAAVITPPQATIVFAGDAMQHSAQIEAARQADGTYSYAGCFDAIAPYISSADYAVVNLETPLGGAPYSGYPCFCAPDSYATALKNAGFDLMLTANNHTLDRRDRGLLRTLDQLDRQQIAHIGTYSTTAARDSMIPMIAEINGFRVGFLNYTYGTNGINVTTDAVVDYIDRDLMHRDITATRDAGAEIVAVAVHWGDEYKLLANKAQRDLADFLVSEGVDIIMGGHPHVIQPMEMITDSISGRRSLIVYSLGNFISNMKTRDTRGGAIVRATLRRDTGGHARVDTATYRLVFTIPPGDGHRNYRLVPAENCDSRLWQPHCDAFAKAATEIFDRHNRNVACDTTAITQTERYD